MTAPPPPLPQADPVAASTAPSAPTPDLVLDLFEPTPESLDAQQANALLSDQIEQALTVTFLITRCGLIAQQEYSDIYNALIRFALASGLSPDLDHAARDVRRLADAAGASYALVYSRIACTDPSLPPLVASIRQWRDQSARTVSDSSSNP